MPATDWAPWEGRTPSTLADHGAPCCAEARAWFLAMDRSLWAGRGGPTWIRRRYDWGPTRWPIHWCEAVTAKELCCGGQAALSIAAFRARGIDAVPAQLVQRYQPHDVPHWYSRWTRGGADPAWLAEGLVYHEVCAVLEGDEARVWNPTAMAWVSPDEARGYGSVVAIRLGGATPSGTTVSWGGMRLPVGEWAGVGEPVTTAP